jgi:hypothetical protein
MLLDDLLTSLTEEQLPSIFEADRRSEVKKRQRDAINREKESRIVSKSIEPYTITKSDQYREDIAWCVKNMPQWELAQKAINEITRDIIYNHILPASHKVWYTVAGKNIQIDETHLVSSSSDRLFLFYVQGNNVVFYRIGNHPRLGIK